MTKDAVDWTSWHLHVASPRTTVTDFALMNAAVPVLVELARRRGRPLWFFVRYWRGGPHLRLRIRGLDDSTADAVTEQLGRRLAPVNAAVPADERLDSAGYRAMASGFASAGEGSGPIPLDDLRAPGVYRESYVPDVAGYGGPALVEVSEALFATSSRLAVGLLHGARSDRIGAGVTVVLASLAALEEVSASHFVRQARDRWSTYAEAAGAQAASVRLRAAARAAGATLADRPEDVLGRLRSSTDALRKWTCSLQEAGVRWAAVVGARDHILGNHLHMLCNRLGLGPGGELYLWELLAEFLARVPQFSPADLAGVSPPNRR